MIRNQQVLWWMLISLLGMPGIGIAQQQGSLWLYPNLNASWLQSDLNTNQPFQYGSIGPGGGLRISPDPRNKRIVPGFQAGLGRVSAQNPELSSTPDPETGDIIFPNRYVETTLFQVEGALHYRITRRYRINPYLMAGAGLQFYFAKDQGGVPLILDRTTRPASEGSYSSMTFSVPLGLGFSWKLSPGLEVQGEYSVRFLGSDFLDNISSLGTQPGNDRIHSLNIAVGIPINRARPLPVLHPPVPDSLPADSVIAVAEPMVEPVVDSIPAPAVPDSLPPPHTVTALPAAIPVPDSCDEPCVIVMVEQLPLRDSLPDTTRAVVAALPPAPDPAALARADSLTSALQTQLLMNQLLQERVRALEAQLARQGQGKDSLAARLVDQSARIERLTYDSTQLVLLAQTLDEDNSALTQQLQEQQKTCTDQVRPLRDSLNLLRTAIETLRAQPLSDPARQAASAAESQLATARMEALEKKLTEFNRKELELKQLQQTSAYLISQQEASLSQDVFVLPVAADTKERPLTEWLTTHQYTPERMTDGAQVFFGVYLPEVSASPLRLRVQTIRLSTGQWMLQVLARRTSDGVWISAVSSPKEAELLGKWIASFY